jgi:hypothetical protein
MNRATIALAGLLALLGLQIASAATITVNSTNDNLTSGNGQCTLRKALRNANTNSDTTGGDCAAGSGVDTIVLPAGTYTFTLTGAGEDLGLTGDLDILESVNITGAGAGSTIIDGASLDRVFDVDPAGTGLTVSITGVTIRNGSVAGFGGGIFVRPFGSSTLNLTDCVVSGNTATGFNGGGIATSDGTTLNLTRVTFRNNTSGFNGGGVACFGCAATLNACAFDGNHSTGGALGGGGLFNGGGTVTITGATIGANVSDSFGGGITNAGFGALTVQNAALTANQATGTGGGGGVSNDPSSGGASSLTLATSRVFGNTSTVATGVGSTGGTLALQNTWWGCNAGPQLPPGGNGCDTVANVAAATPWLVLRVGAAPGAVPLAGVSAVTADVTYNSASVHVVSGNIPDSPTTPNIAFGGTLGSVSPASVALTSGLASSTFTAGLVGGAGSASATLDNATATVPILVNQAAAITVQPTNQTVCAGATATFTAAASGNPAPTLQWQVSTDGGATFADLGGATSTTLSFLATAPQNGNQYRAVFTNTGGTATTTAALLTVNTAPAVTTNPTNQSVGSGQSVSFTASASGTPAPTVQWQVSTNGGVTFTNVAGATSATFTHSAPLSENGYQYRAVFTNACGTATTAAATLTVTPSRSFTGPTPGGGGDATVSFSTGDSGCTFITSGWIPLSGGAGSPPAGSAPSGFSFPYGLFDFAVEGCSLGATLNFTLTMPSALPPGTVYWKYGPTSSQPAPHWYELPATITGNTITFSITDGGLGDSSPTPDGNIVDQGGPGIPGEAIPTFGLAGLIALIALLALTGAFVLARGRFTP